MQPGCLYVAQADVRRSVCPDPRWLEENQRIVDAATGAEVWEQLGVRETVKDGQNGPTLDWSEFQRIFNCNWRAGGGPTHFCCRSATDRTPCCVSREESRATMKRVCRQMFSDVFFGMEATKKWCEGAKTSARLAPLSKCCKLLQRASQAERLLD